MARKKKQLPPGSDVQNTTDEYDEPRVVKAMEDDEDLQDSIDFKETSADLFNQLVRYMRARGIKALAVPGGTWAGFELYVLEPFKVPGLQVPKDFKYWRALRTYEEADRLIVKDAIQNCASIECAGGADNKTQARWLGFVEAWTVYQSNERTSLYQIASGMKTVAPYRTRTFKGASGHHVVVPPAEWFPEAVRNVSLYDLLSILPEAEADMLMLNLGRIVVGQRDQECAEGYIDHDYRYFCGIVGGANLGKSRLIEWYIKPALLQMGCKIETWNLRRDNPFGWAKRACADSYFLSDVLTKDTVEVIADPQQKVLSSGEALSTEDKGVSSVVIERPTAGGFTFLSNGLNIAKLQMLDDDGVTDRFKCLTCRERAELRELYGQEPGSDDPKALAGMTGLIWERLAKEAGVSTEVLALWLLSNCATRFLEAVGYTFTPDNRLEAPETPQLKRYVADLSTKLRMGTVVKAKEDVVKAISHGLAYTIAQMGAAHKKIVLSHSDEIEFSHELLMIAACVTCYNRPKDDSQQWCWNFHIDCLAVITCRPFLEKHSRDLTNIHYTKEPQTAFEYVASLLKTRQNMFGFPSHPVAYGNLWRSALVELPILVKYYVDNELLAAGDYNQFLDGYRAQLMPIISKYTA
jgi:hypothetical protein